MESHIQILKFGGTSVGSGERIRRVAEIIARTRRDPDEAFPAVVVSAMSKVTDHLLRIAHLTISSDDEARVRAVESLRYRHFEAAEQAVSRRATRRVLRRDLETTFAGLDSAIDALRALAQEQASTARDLAIGAAAIASYGERLSVLLVAAAIRELGLEAAPVREEVIITAMPGADVPHSASQVIGADPLGEETRANAQRLVYPLIERGIVPIMAGFIGRTVDGVITTLGRNGSDYSASVIGAALDCVEISIYSDVDGVLTADPRLVMNARLLPRLTYAEAARLSWFGAKVLHPRTLIPIAQRHIPVRVRNTFHPQVRGTLVGPDSRQPSGAAAITVRRRLALITVESTDLFGAPENAGQVFALAARAGAAPVAICSSSGQHLSFVVEEQAASSVVALLQREMKTFGAHGQPEWRVKMRNGLAACACIGSGFVADPMSPARAITALARERIPLITQGASALGIVLIIEDRDSERALRGLHRDLIAPVIPLVRPARTVQEKRRDRSAIGE
jgi:aspartate kinase